MIKVYFALEIFLIMFKKRTLRESYYIQRKIKNTFIYYRFILPCMARITVYCTSLISANVMSLYS